MKYSLGAKLFIAGMGSGLCSERGLVGVLIYE
ncbi:Uncharacterised protein [Leminorella grimontii]|nr:Uncharacterised protein [Leminorella grimontii]